MRDKKNMILGIVVIAMCVALFLEPLTGEMVHVVLGILVFITLVGHTCRQIVKIKSKKSAVRLVDEGMMVSLTAAFLSGVLMHPLKNAFALVMVHRLAAVVFAICLIAHIMQHFPAIAGTTKANRKRD